jgi:hypothetical protein
METECVKGVIEISNINNNSDDESDDESDDNSDDYIKN